MSALPRTPSFRLDGRRAIVTGASRGIGLASAVALAEAGAEVTLVARGRDELEARAGEIRAAFGTASALPLDVGDVDAVEREIRGAGPVDILVNNAGVSRHRPMLETRPDDFDHVISINLRAAYFVAKSVAAGIVESGRAGATINISSQMGHVGGFDRTVYNASKHAIEGLTKPMAIELGPRHVRVNSIGPTFIKLPLTASTLADPIRRAWIESKIKLGRLAEVEDIMGGIVFLASDAAAMITGTSLLIDGGWTAG